MSRARGAELRARAVRLSASDIFEMVALGLIYYVAARLSLRLALIQDNVTPLWPPTGIAVVAFLLYGRRCWPGVAIAAFFVNLPISTSAAAAVTAVGNVWRRSPPRGCWSGSTSIRLRSGSRRRRARVPGRAAQHDDQCHDRNGRPRPIQRGLGRRFLAGLVGVVDRRRDGRVGLRPLPAVPHRVAAAPSAARDARRGRGGCLGRHAGGRRSLRWSTVPSCSSWCRRSLAGRMAISAARCRPRRPAGVEPRGVVGGGGDWRVRRSFARPPDARPPALQRHGRLHGVLRVGARVGADRCTRAARTISG